MYIESKVIDRFLISTLLQKIFELKSRVWIAVRPTENDSTRLYKNGDIQVFSAVASSNLVDRKSKYYFIIKFSLLFSIKRLWREIRPDTSKTTEK